MQTTTLPIQVSGASAPNAPQRGGADSDAGQFTAALSREIEQRRQPPAAPPSPQPAKREASQKPQDAGKPAQADAKAPAQEPGKPDEAQVSTASGTDDDTQADPAQDAGAPAAQPDPLAEMLAMVASFSQALQKNSRAAGETAPEAATPGGAVNAGAEAGQLTALQTAFRQLDKGPGDSAQPAIAANPGEQRAPLPEALTGATRKGAPPQAADLRPVAEPLGQPKSPPGEALVKMQAGEGDLRMQQARESVAQVEAMKASDPAAQFVVQARPAIEGSAQLAAAAREYLPARVGTPAWDNQVGQKIVWMVAGGEQSASLTLNPPDLGPMQVVLNVTGDHASVTFSANQQEVRQALENALPRLREMMGESGIALGSATVNAGMPDQRQAQGGQAGAGSDGSAGGGARLDNRPASADVAPRSAARTTMLDGRGMVDTFA